MQERIVAWLVLLAAVCGVCGPAFGAVWCVNKDATGAQDGQSWATAFTTIQPAIDAASDAGGGEVWVAEGVYDEARTIPNADGSGADTGSVLMKEGVHLYGGFAGTETQRDQRDWETRITAIDGATARSGGAAYHVVVGANDSTLDGFTITGGSANGGTDWLDSRKNGGGMYNYSSSPTVANCSFSGNSADRGGGMFNFATAPTVTNCSFTGNSAGSGGGMYNEAPSSSPTVTNCSFSGNSADNGGGMYNSGSVSNCTFSDNSAADDGGGMYNSGSVSNCTFSDNSAADNGGGMYNGDGMYNSLSPTVTNCVFWRNEALDTGGAVFNSGASPTITNCSFSSNSCVPPGGAIYNSTSGWGPAANPVITNCILWGDTSPEIFNDEGCSATVTHCLVQGGYAEGSYVQDQNPGFVNVSTGDLRLRSTSPCIDAGTPVAGLDTDILGAARPAGNAMDLGAYEYGASPAEGEGEGEGDGITCLPAGTASSAKPDFRHTGADLLLVAAAFAALYRPRRFAH